MLTIPTSMIPAERDASRGNEITWEESTCPLCDHPDYRPILEAADPHDGPTGPRFCVVECLHCGMKYTNPRPNTASIGQFYPMHYRPHQRVHQNRPTLRKWYPLAALQGRPVRERRNLPMQGNGQLLDFGCGNGSFLQRMHEQGWDVTGLDFSRDAVRNIRDQLGLRAFQGTLPHEGLEAQSFDVITMWHSLEHVHSPRQILSEAHRLLVPGGRLIVAVPNIDSWPYRQFQQHWFGLDLPRHLSHFTGPTLRQMLVSTGYRVDDLRAVRHSDWLRSSAKLAWGGGLLTPLNRLLHNKSVARLAAWVAYLLRQSDCILAFAVKQSDGPSAKWAEPHEPSSPDRHIRDIPWFETNRE